MFLLQLQYARLKDSRLKLPHSLRCPADTYFTQVAMRLSKALSAPAPAPRHLRPLSCWEGLRQRKAGRQAPWKGGWPNEWSAGRGRHLSHKSCSKKHLFLQFKTGKAFLQGGDLEEAHYPHKSTAKNEQTVAFGHYEDPPEAQAVARQCQDMQGKFYSCTGYRLLNGLREGSVSMPWWGETQVVETTSFSLYVWH